MAEWNRLEQWPTLGRVASIGSSRVENRITQVVADADRGRGNAWPTWSGTLASGAVRLLPGGVLSVAVTFTAIVMQALETGLFGRAWIEALVLAILLGTVVRSAWAYGPAWAAGVQFSARTLLEIAVCLLGASISTRAIAAASPALLCGNCVVIVTIGSSYGMAACSACRARWRCWLRAATRRLRR